MRLVQVTVPAGKREAVLRELDEEGIDYVLSEETSSREFTGVVSFPVPTSAVEPVLDRLHEVGIDEDAYTVVLDAETVISRRFDQLEDRYAAEDSESRISREELRTRADDLMSGPRTYAVLTVVSAVIATAGLLLDSPAVVVGSMVIAPLIGPAMAASVGTVLDDPELFVRGVKLQIVGLVLAIGSAAAFALVLRGTLLIPPGIEVTEIPQVRERLAPDVLSLAVALGAGVAGVVSLATGVSSAIVGVMIAVALIPPAATVGIGIAWGLPTASLGSGVLLLVNVLSINLAALVVLWYAGYRPTEWFKLGETRRAFAKRIVVLAVAIAVLSVFLGGVTYDSFRNAATEQDIRNTVEGVTNNTTGEMRLLEVQITQSDGVVFRDPRLVVVTVGVPPERTPSGLAARINGRINRTVERDIPVQVRFVEVEQVGSATARDPDGTGPSGDDR